MKRLRLLVWDEAIISGGVEVLRLNLLPALHALCEEVVWIVPDHILPVWREMLPKAPNFRIVSLFWPRRSWQRFASGLLRRLSGSLRGVSKLETALRNARLRALIRTHRMDAVLTTCVYSAPLPTVQVPVGGILHDVSPLLENAILANFQHWMNRAQLIFAVSKFTANTLRAKWPDHRAELISVASAARAVIAERETHRAVCVEPTRKAPIFYYPAGIAQNKGHDTLLEACVLLANRGVAFCLILTGLGTQSLAEEVALTHAAQERARQVYLQNFSVLSGRVRLMGYVDREAVKAYFTQCDVVVLPTEYEGFGLPLVEALEYGKLVVATDIPPFQEQLDTYQSHDRAILVPVRDSVLLAGAMHRALAMEPRCLPAPQVEQRLAKRTWNHVASEVVDAFASVLQQ